MYTSSLSASEDTVSNSPANNGHYEKYRADFFAGREVEWGLFRDKIRSIQKAPLRGPLIETYGVTGIGKSWLLEHIHTRFRYGQADSRQLNDQKLEKPTCTALIDFERFPPPDLAARVSEARFATIVFNLLKPAIDEIVHQLQEQGEVVTPPSCFAPEHPPKRQKVEEVSIAFKDFIAHLSENKVPILLFDTTEQLFKALPERESTLLDWLEENLIYPLARTDRVILVFSGRRRLRWKKFEVRRRVEPYHLETFTKDDSEQQLLKLTGEAGETISRTIYDYTFGHPFANKVIFDALCQISQTQRAPLSPSLLAQHETEISTLLNDRVIEGKFLEGLPPTLKHFLRLIATVRKFNANPLRYFAGKFIDPKYEREPGSVYLEAIRAMVDSTLVEWSSAHGGYVLDPVVRRMINKHQWITNATSYKERHNAALKLYQSWITEYPENSSTYLIEALFHLFSLRRAEGVSGEPLLQELLTLLRETISNALPQNMDIATFLKEELSRDGEIEEAVSSISSDAFSALLQVVQEFEARLAAEAHQ